MMLLLGPMGGTVKCPSTIEWGCSCMENLPHDASALEQDRKISTTSPSSNCSLSTLQVAVSKNQGPHFGSPYNKDHNMFGFILGPPIYGSPQVGSLSVPPRFRPTWEPPDFSLKVQSTVSIGYCPRPLRVG